MSDRSKEILCTLGPSSMSPMVISRMEGLGVTLFRINLSHTAIRDLPETIRFIQAHSSVPICLDTEGAQIRTGVLVDGSTEVRENSVLRLHRRRVPGDSANLNLNPADAIDYLSVGDFLNIDFNAVMAQVIDNDGNTATLRVVNGGRIGSSKGVSLQRQVPLPPLTEKDQEAIRIGREMGLRHFALSFANRGEDVAEIRALAGDDAFIISKIESYSGIMNLDDIVAASDALLIDRGDLSRDISVEQIPKAQKRIIEVGTKANRPVYVATNLLESMVSVPVPTRAEINDIYNTLLDGASGLVLAAETAIGEFPILCTSMIVKIIRSFESEPQRGDNYYPDDPVSLLVEPHGGKLVHREATEEDIASADSFPKLAVPLTALMDCEQISLGTYSPITGFMNRETLEEVLSHNRLPGGPAWTLPILLQVSPEKAKGLARGNRVALTSNTGTVHAIMSIEEIYSVDMADVARRWFGTDSADHPGVARFMAEGECLIGGEISLVERLPSPYRHYELTPAQTRFIFTHKGWSRVIGFHTRNPVHRGHEAIQLLALNRTNADGLYINPVIGPKKTGDFLPEPIMMSYQTMLDFGCYPRNKVVLGSFATYSRYAGPREAVFTALARKNMGCSHFIIGRDHTGVSSFYSPDANMAMFDDLSDIGITPEFFESVGYDAEADDYRPVGSGTELMEISGTRIRNTLQSAGQLPEWIMRDVVQDMLRSYLADQKSLFVE